MLDRAKAVTQNAGARRSKKGVLPGTVTRLLVGCQGADAEAAAKTI